MLNQLWHGLQMNSVVCCYSKWSYCVFQKVQSNATTNNVYYLTVGFNKEDSNKKTKTLISFQPGNDSGCTAVVALLRGNKLLVANAGDSRCIVCREGKAIEMSADHKPGKISTANLLLKWSFYIDFFTYVPLWYYRMSIQFSSYLSCFWD